MQGADDALFLACFAEQIEVHWEPAVAQRPLVRSRDELGDWVRRIREEHPRLEVTVTEPEAHGNGSVCELIVVRDVAPSEVWRVALAVCVIDDLIREVRAFWSRERAIDWVVEFW